jgi:hypothetical protein
MKDLMFERKISMKRNHGNAHMDDAIVGVKGICRIQIATRENGPHNQ